MSITTIIALLTAFGPSAVNLITTLIAKWETNGTVSSAEWATLTANLSLGAKDQMTAMLTKAGIDPTSAQGQSLLALIK